MPLPGPRGTEEGIEKEELEGGESPELAYGDAF